MSTETSCILTPACGATVKPQLDFHRMTFNSIPLVKQYLERSGSMSCDYTIGGIYMWIEYFKYQYCIFNDTLFIKGVAEDDVERTAFSLPIGKMPLEKSVEMLRQYCGWHSLPLTFSAIPEEHISAFKSLNPTSVGLLEHWSDYIYTAESLSTLEGNKLKKKRNRVNKFLATYRNHEIQTITPQNLPAVKKFYSELSAMKQDGGMAAYERRQVGHVLDHYWHYPFEGIILMVGGQIAAFSIAEAIGDTLHVHIEKTDHKWVGANEYINMAMVRHCMEKHGIKYVNREDDAGDEGLRQAKLAYNPIILLNKYNVTFG